MYQILVLFALPALVVTIIILFYFCFKLAWPKIYFSVNDMASLLISVSPRRYFAFRLLPVLIITTLVLGTFNDILSDYELLVAGFIAGAMYSICTDLLAIYKILTSSKTIKHFFNKNFQILVHVITSLVLITICSGAGLIARHEWVSYITPTPAGVIDNLYSSLLTALLAVVFYKLYTENKDTEDDIFSQAREKISKPLITHLKKESVRLNANTNLVISICIVENIQRPAWVRKIEYLKGKIFREGSYGIMQVQSARPISDKESITIAIEKFFKDTEEMTYEEIVKKILEYNNSEIYMDIVLRAYSYLRPDEFERM